MLDVDICRVRGARKLELLMKINAQSRAEILFIKLSFRQCTR